MVSFSVQPNPIVYLELIMEHSENSAQMARGQELLIHTFSGSLVPYMYRAEDVFWRTCVPWTYVSWSPGHNVPCWCRALWGPGTASPCAAVIFLLL